MNQRSIGFVGGGRIVRIILEGWQKAGALPPRVVVCDLADVVLGNLKARWPQLQTDLNGNAAAAAQDIVFLAVHPPAIPEAIAAIRPNLRPQAILVSLAPKFTIAKLSQLLGGFDRIARVIPNAPSIVGAGFNPLAFSAAMSQAERNTVLDLWKPLGDCPELAEEKLEACAILTAMGPTYFWFQFYELCSLAQSFGLSAQDAQVALEKMLAGALQTMFRSGLTAEEVKDLIPVKPMGDAEASMIEMYRSELNAIMQKIKPA